MSDQDKKDPNFNPAFPPDPDNFPHKQEQTEKKSGQEKRDEARSKVDETNKKNNSTEATPRDNTKGSGPVTMTGDRETPLPDEHEEDDTGAGPHKNMPE